MCLSQPAAGIDRCVIDRLEYGHVEFASTHRSEGQVEQLEDISQTLNAHPDSSCAARRRRDFRTRIFGHVDAAVGIGDDDANDTLEPSEVKRAVDVNARRQGYGGKGTHSGPRWRRELYNFSAQIGGVYDTEVLFIVAICSIRAAQEAVSRLCSPSGILPTIDVVLEQEERATGLALTVNYRSPQDVDIVVANSHA